MDKTVSTIDIFLWYFGSNVNSIKNRIEERRRKKVFRKKSLSMKKNFFVHGRQHVMLLVTQYQCIQIHMPIYRAQVYSRPLRCIWSICAFDQMRCAYGKCAFDQSPNHDSNPSINPNPNPNPNPFQTVTLSLTLIRETDISLTNQLADSQLADKTPR